MKKLIFLYSRKCIFKLRRFLGADNGLVVSLNPDIDRLLKSLGISFKSVNDYYFEGLSYDGILNDNLEFLKSIAEIEIDGRSIGDHLKINGICMWDLLNEELHEIDIAVLIKYLQIINSILLAEVPDHVCFCSYSKIALHEKNKNYFPELIRVAARFNNIIFTSVESGLSYANVVNRLIRKIYQAVGLMREFQRRNKIHYRLRKNKRRVLFVNYGPGNKKLGITEPIYRDLMRNGYDAVTICSDGLSSNITSRLLLEKKMKFANYESFLDKDIYNKVRSYDKDFSRLWLRIRMDKIIQDKFIFKGFLMYPVIFPYLDNIFNYRLRHLAKIILAMEKIFDKLSPDVTVVQTDQNFFTKAAVLTSRKKGIKSLVVQHGAYAGCSAFPALVADKIALWSDREYDNMKKYIDSNRLVITGSISHEHIMNSMSHVDKKKVFSDLGLKDIMNRNVPVILFVSVYNAINDFERIKCFLEVVKDMDVFCIVKLHPAESTVNVGYLSRVFRDYSSVVLFLKHYDFMRLLMISRLVIGVRHCTTTIDTLISGRPLIIFEGEERFCMDSAALSFGDDGPFISVKDKSGLMNAIDKLLSDESAMGVLLRKENEYKIKHFIFDGHVIDRIRNVITDLMGD